MYAGLTHTAPATFFARSSRTEGYIQRMRSFGNLTFLKNYAYPQTTVDADFAVGSKTGTWTVTRSSTTPATYVDSSGVIQIKTNQTPRFTSGFYDSTGFVSRPGLIVEGAGTNLLTYSRDYTNAAWSKTNITAIAFNSTFTSPETNSHQGYATDGTYHYTFDTTTIYKRNNDASWSVNTSNTTPFSGLDASYNHLGDGSVYNGKLYIAGEQWTACGDTSLASILIFNTSDLSRESVTDVSSQLAEIAGVAVDSDNGFVYAVSYCDGSKVWKYNLSDMTYVDAITLSSTLTHPQGIAYKNGKLYIALDGGSLYLSDLSGNLQYLGSTGLSGNNEGLDYSQSTLRWMNDDGAGNRLVNFYDIASSVAPDGANAVTLTATDANATILQALTIASAVKTYSVFLKRKTGTGNIDITVDGGTTWTTVSLSTTDWRRFQVTQVLANPSSGIRIVTSGDEVYAWESQTEAVGNGSTPIYTVASQVTRNAEALTYLTSGNRTAASESVFVKFTPFFDPTKITNYQAIIDTKTKRRYFTQFHSGVSSTRVFTKANGTDDTTKQVFLGSDLTQFASVVLAATYQHSSPYIAAYKDGVSSGNNWTASDWTNPVWGTTMHIGHSQAGIGNEQLYGIIQAIAIFSDAKSAENVASISSLMSAS